ncbi:MAG: hypothetical protein MZV63_46850 [Marinilabiliales bacterium]|nr:hypothetical protein [Marinilabiliales bacterium]
MRGPVFVRRNRPAAFGQRGGHQRHGRRLGPAADDGCGERLAPMVDLFLERGVALPGPSDPLMPGLVSFSVKTMAWSSW